MKDDKWRKILYPALACWAVLLLTVLLYVKVVGVGERKPNPGVREVVPNETLNQRSSSDADVRDAADSTTLVGNQMPRFELRTSDGRLVSSKSLKGKPAVIEFFASWCPHCRNIAPTMDKTVGKDKRVRFMMVSAAREKKETVTRWFDTFLGHPMNAQLLFDSSLNVSKTYGVAGYPTIVFVDKHGTIRYIATGEIPANAIKSKLDSISAR